MKKRENMAGAFMLILWVSSFCPAKGQSPRKPEFGYFIATGAFDLYSARELSQSRDSEIKEPDRLLILTLLFQETASWTPILTMPRLGIADFDLVEGNLRRAYRGSKIFEPEDSDTERRRYGCSLIDELFDRAEMPERPFYRFDIDADGIDDIIYTGPALCAEGDLTIIWFGRESGFEIRQNALWRMELLLVLPGSSAKLGSVAVGCCGAPDDEYFIGTLNNYSQAGRRNIFKFTPMPEILTGPTKFRVRGTELILRSSPEIDDTYEEGRGEFWQNAVFGNILSKYLPGCGGTVIGTNKGEESGLWYFVTLDGCERFRTHSPFEVSAGWVEASSVQPIELRPGR